MIMLTRQRSPRTFVSLCYTMAVCLKDEQLDTGKARSGRDLTFLMAMNSISTQQYEDFGFISNMEIAVEQSKHDN